MRGPGQVLDLGTCRGSGDCILHDPEGWATRYLARAYMHKSRLRMKVLELLAELLIAGRFAAGEATAHRGGGGELGQEACGGARGY